MMFYTYAHIRKSDNQYFYIGKGHNTPKRIRSHEMKCRSAHHKAVVAKHGVIVEVLAHWKTEEEAFDHEKLLISCFKDMGHPLVNKTNGGDGIAGFKHSDATKAKIKASNSTPEAIARQSAKAKITNAIPSVKEKQKQKTKEALAKPEIKAKLIAATTAYANTAEGKANKSKAAALSWINATPEQIAERKRKIGEANRIALKGKKQSPETIAKRMATMAAKKGAQ